MHLTIWTLGFTMRFGQKLIARRISYPQRYHYFKYLTNKNKECLLVQFYLRFPFKIEVLMYFHKRLRW